MKGDQMQKNSIPDEFLLAEEREGFLIPASIKQAWAAQLEVLMEIDRVCKKHGIHYFADWGSFLGTVRHGGYIPWDDDLDIVMKRADYQKFMEVARLDMEEGFHVQTFENQEDHWLFIGKVVGRNKICFEKEHLRRFHNFPYIACVDIFVLDYVYRDPEKEENRRQACKYLLGVADSIVEGRLSKESALAYLAKAGQLSGRSFRWIDEPVAMGRYLYKQVEEIFAEVPESESDFLVQLFPWGLKGNARYYPKEYYQAEIRLPFEFTTMPVPVAYDTMLRGRYGQYWNVVKGAGAHDYPFFEAQKRNFQKVLDFPLPQFRFEEAMLKDVRKNGTDAREAVNCSGQAGGFKELAMAYIEQINELLCGNKMADNIHRNQAVVNTNGQIQPEAIGGAVFDVETVVAFLPDLQQLAIELGTLIEEVWGEGHETVSLLESFCEKLFYVHEAYEKVQSGNSNSVAPAGLSSEQANDSSGTFMVEQRQSCLEESIRDCVAVWSKCKEEIQKQLLDRKSILFLPVRAADWKFMQPLWEQYRANAEYDVFVVPLTYFYKDYDGAPRRTVCEKEQFPAEVEVFDIADFSRERIRLMHPDMIVIQNPYDEWNEAISVPREYFSKALRDCTDKLIYVPPFYLEDFDESQICEYHNMKYYVTMPGVVYADEVLVQSEKMRAVYIRKLVEFAGEETRAVWEEKIRIADWYSAADREKSQTGGVAQNSVMLSSVKPDGGEQNASQNECKVEKTILYCVSVGCLIEHRALAFQKIKDNMNIFQKNPKIRVLWYTYPQISKEIMQLDSDLFEKYRILQQEYADFENVTLLQLESEEEAVLAKLQEIAKECDGYYGDGSPCVSMFRVLKKPVMIQNYEIRGD